MTSGDSVEFPNDEIRRQVRASQAEHDRALPMLREVLDRLFDDEQVTADQRADVVLGGIHRRRFLRLGGVAVLSSAVLAACGKSSKSSGATSTAPTTAAPSGSTKDINILRAASSMEEVAVATYQKAIDSGLVKTSAVQAAAQAFQAQHKLHSNFFQNATV